MTDNRLRAVGPITARMWCFLIHRWFVDTTEANGGYRCVRCGEVWTRP
jgi:hypothetical protein